MTSLIQLYFVGGLAGVLGFCPWGGSRPCPKARISSLGLVSGGGTALLYDVTLLGKRALEVPDLFAVALSAFLFSYFIKILFFSRREA